MKLQFIAALFTVISSTSAFNSRARHAHLAHKRQQPQASTQASPLPPSSSSSLPSPSPSASLPASSSTSTSLSMPTPASNTSTSSIGPTTPVAATGSGIPPLANLTFGMPTQSTLPVTTTYAAQASAPIPGAPPLPTPFVFKVADWPTQDITPDTTSDQVQEWMKELDGFCIPDINPTVDGSCVNDTAAAADAANRGWWTCGGHTRDTDITSCPDKYTWGVSFDDGPSPYTQKLLGYLDQQSILSTFFVVGSRVIERPNVLIEEYMSGHEISVHTWSHRHLTALSNEGVVAELGWTRKAIKDVLGVTPTTMRPPYGDIDDRVRAISMAMGMIPIIWTSTPTAGKFDTNDWQVAGGMMTGNQSFASFEAILGNSSLIDTGFIVLQHDLFETTVDLAMGYTLNAALTHVPQLTLKPIGQCSNIPPTDLYAESNTNKTLVPAFHPISQCATTHVESAASHGIVPYFTLLFAMVFAVIGAI